MKKFLNKDSIIVVLLIAIGVLFYMWNNNRLQIKERNAVISALDSDLETWKDRDSLNHARIQVIETQRVKDFLVIKTNDSLIQELQKTVEDFKKHLQDKGSVTIIKTETKVETKTKTEIVYRDTIITDSIKYVYPEYRSQFDLGGWVIGSSISNKDTIQLDLNIKNDYSVIIGQEKQGLFKASKPFVEVINKNPYTETKNIRTYRVAIKRKKRFSIGPGIGVGLSGDGHIQPYIGIGVQYNLLKF